uniref:Uncharacterized protein n=1 Tax=Romanomermis culicivorax TaxID=13658 RepID=A0A915IDA7_ROMCU
MPKTDLLKKSYPNDHQPLANKAMATKAKTVSKPVKPIFSDTTITSIFKTLLTSSAINTCIAEILAIQDRE